MKTHRKSRSAENRNARKAITFRGGTSRNVTGLPEGQRLVSGRLLRRAQKSGSSRLQAYVFNEDGTLGRPIATDGQPGGLGVLSMEVDIDLIALAGPGWHLI